MSRKKRRPKKRKMAIKLSTPFLVSKKPITGKSLKILTDSS